MLLKTHKEAQEAERAAARNCGTTKDGCSPRPRADRSTRPPVARRRHTAATVLAILAVPTPTAMAIMGWSRAEMAARYQHVLDSIRKGVADQVGGLLWGTGDEADKTDNEG